MVHIKKINEMYNTTDGDRNIVISSHISELLKGDVKGFLNALDNLNDCKSFEDVKKRGLSVKHYLKSLSEQIDALIESYNPNTLDYLLSATKDMLKDKSIVDTIIDDLTEFYKGAFYELENFGGDNIIGWGIKFNNLVYYFRYLYTYANNGGYEHDAFGGVAAYMGYQSVTKWAGSKGYDENSNEFDNEVYKPSKDDYIKNVQKKYPVSIDFVNDNTGASFTITDKKTINDLVEIMFDTKNMGNRTNKVIELTAEI